MSETSDNQYYEPATLPWKIVTYLLLSAAIFFVIYGISRFLIGTFFILNATDNSFYSFFVLPATIFLTPVVSLYVPLAVLRDTSMAQVRQMIIGSGLVLAFVFTIVVLMPQLASVLWGI